MFISSLRFVGNCPLVKKDQCEKAKSMGYMLQKGVGSTTLHMHFAMDVEKTFSLFVCVCIELLVLSI